MPSPRDRNEESLEVNKLLPYYPAMLKSELKENFSHESTRIHRHINAPRKAVYRALVDASTIVKWKVPDGMTAEVHSFDGPH